MIIVGGIFTPCLSTGGGGGEILGYIFKNISGWDPGAVFLSRRHQENQSRTISKLNKVNHFAKMKFYIKHFANKCDQIRSFLRIWSHLLEKSTMENFIFLCSELTNTRLTQKHESAWGTFKCQRTLWNISLVIKESLRIQNGA